MKRTFMFVMLILALQLVTAQNAKKSGKYDLCSNCGYYHYANDLCDDVKESADPSYFNTNGAKNIKFKEFQDLEVQNGIHVIIIEGKEDFILANGSATILKGFKTKAVKNLLRLTSFESHREINAGDSTICYVLVSRSSKNPIGKVKATEGSVVTILEELNYKRLTVEATTASEINVNTKMKSFKCIAKTGATINLTADSDSISLASETGAVINAKGKMKNLSCNAGYASKINFDVNANNINIVAFHSSLVIGKGECAKIDADINDASKCDITNLNAKNTSVYAYNASDIHIRASNRLNSLVEKMSLLHIYEMEKGEFVYTTDEKGNKVKVKTMSYIPVNVNK